jgi:S1-C subfamily serine protease
MLTCLLSTLSCDVQVNKNKNPANKVDAFVFLRKLIILKAGNIEASGEISTASGSCIKSDVYNDTKTVLTVSHFCRKRDIKNMQAFKSLKSVVSKNNDNKVTIQAQRKIEVILHNGKKVSAKIIKEDKENDLCLLELINNQCIDNITIAKSRPKPGDSIVNFSAPLSIFNPGTVLFFDGRYAGPDISGLNYLFSVPTTYGASGSPLLNSNLDLISVMKMTIVKFNHVSLGANLKSINEFVHNK